MSLNAIQNPDKCITIAKPEKRVFCFHLSSSCSRFPIHDKSSTNEAARNRLLCFQFVNAFRMNCQSARALQTHTNTFATESHTIEHSTPWATTLLSLALAVSVSRLHMVEQLKENNRIDYSKHHASFASCQIGIQYTSDLYCESNS